MSSADKTLDLAIQALATGLSEETGVDSADALSILRVMHKHGLLVQAAEWDVEYRDGDSTIRHTVESFEETELTKEQAEEYAREYNALDSAPGSAVVVLRYVTPFREA